jgi:hypothetical protein
MKNVLVENLALVVLFILSLFANASQFRVNAQPNPEGQTCIHSADSHARPYRDMDLPLGSNDSLPGETPNKNELEEETDSDEDGKEHSHRHLAGGVAYILIESSGLRCAQMVENHHNVSLFILYHSWKSYLS